MSVFNDCAVVSCGTLRAELSALREQGFLDARRIFYTAPGLHEEPPELERQLRSQLARAVELAPRVIVVYGSKCFVDYDRPERDIEVVIREAAPGARRVDAANCVDMLADSEQRAQLAAGQKVYWLTPGWVANWRYIFRTWDAGKANETFPQNDKALLLDGVGFFGRYCAEKPAELLRFSDWMRIPIEPHEISLERLRRLLLAAARATGPSGRI